MRNGLPLNGSFRTFGLSFFRWEEKRVRERFRFSSMVKTGMRIARYAPILLAAFTFAAFLASSAGGAEAPSPGAERPNPILALQIHGSKLSLGEPVRITLEITNRSPETVRLTFSTGQRFDLSLENASGREVWRWSDGRLFTQALGEEVLKPSSGALRFDATIPAPRSQGRYTLHGQITSTNLTLRASAPFQVR